MKTKHNLDSAQKGCTCCFIALLISFAFTSSVTAQYINGSRPSSEYFALLSANQADEELFIVDTLNPQLNVLLTIQVIVVASRDGESNFNESELETGIANANRYFDNIGMQFQLSDYKVIPEYEYAKILHRDSTIEMELKYAKQDYINLFLVDTLAPEGTQMYGYTRFPGESQYYSIFLNKEYLNGNYISTLLGNFFGLLNTHESLGGSETVDGQNCTEAGDYICDTYADPGLVGFVDENCLYTGNYIDSKGEFYVPSVAYVMSESNDFCKCNFTLQQYRRMKYYYMKYLYGLR